MPDSASHVPDPTHAEPLDLAQRLARYRARIEREGRREAVERLDRAIDKASKKRR